MQSHIIRLDPDGLNIMTEDFRDVYANNLLWKIAEGNGRIFLTEVDNEIVGMIAGCVEVFDDDRVTYRCPAEERIVELFVAENARNKSVW